MLAAQNGDLEVARLRCEATSATYAFFTYELRDVYLELHKPRFYGKPADDAGVQDRKCAHDVLF
eukprot:10608582-Heterocapsa_arctica.AAC.1